MVCRTCRTVQKKVWMDALGISQKGYIFKFLSRQSQGVPRAEAESLRRESAKKELLLQGMENIEAEREEHQSPMLPWSKSPSIHLTS